MTTSNCPHPDDQLQIRGVYDPATPAGYQRPRIGFEMWCHACKNSLAPCRDFEDFVQLREAKYKLETGNASVVIADMFGTPIEIGSMVVYPSLSGRSAQIAYGEVIGINSVERTWEQKATRYRVDQPDSLRVQPVGSARWKKYYHSYGKQPTDPPKAINLTANAPSAVVIK